MSLPDTVFIFVLALIIFGPKKLPEIGRQLGKLVGEFRRASNEFKFQIEEELRQAELTDRNTSAPAKKELETATSAEISTDIPESPTPDPPYPEETLPVGQYPNIDTVNPQDLSSAESTRAEDAAEREQAGARKQRGRACHQSCSRHRTPHHTALLCGVHIGTAIASDPRVGGGKCDTSSQSRTRRSLCCPHGSGRHSWLICWTAPAPLWAIEPNCPA